VTIAEPIASDDILSFYKSVGQPDADLVRVVVERAVAEGIVPSQVRYGHFQKSIRGAFADVNGQAGYFTTLANGELRIIKAVENLQVHEAQRLLKTLEVGVDLVKADSKDEDEEKKDGKADIAALPPAPRPEAVDVATQNSQTTQVHPGATSAQTPESPDAVARWHGEGKSEEVQKSWSTASLMQSWGQALQKSAPRALSTVSPLERKFMTEVLGRKSADIDIGKSRLTPQERIQMRDWANKSLRSRLDALAAKLGQK